jgi:hypothetical protein
MCRWGVVGGRISAACDLVTAIAHWCGLDACRVDLRERLRIVFSEPGENFIGCHRNLVPRQSVTVKIPRSRYSTAQFPHERVAPFRKTSERTIKVHPHRHMQFQEASR